MSRRSIMDCLPDKRLLIATGNAKKAREIFSLLEPLPLSAVSLTDVGVSSEVEETGLTFAENALLKARAAAGAAGMPALADDSGLMVDALDGQPGVHSARYAGQPRSDAANNEKLLAALAEVPLERRTARFVCTLVLVDAAGQVLKEVEGHCRGRILLDHRGREGFGYDPLFWIPEYHRTFGELGLAVKSALSHRARAFQRLLR